MKTFLPLYFLGLILLSISSCSYTDRTFGSSNGGSSPSSSISDLFLGQEPVPPAPVPMPQVAPAPGVLPIPANIGATPAPASAAQNVNAKYKIGLLVPLSGRSASIGKSLSDAAQMAIFETGSADFQILPFDSGDTNATTGAAADAAIAAGVNIILGPVYSDKVGVVAAKAKRAGIKVISFSNNKAVAGGNVYIMGLMPDQQTVRVLKYASDRGVKGYSAILPNNVFGNQVAELVQRHAEWVGGSLRHIALYSGSKPDYNLAGKEIADAFKEKSIVPNRKDEAMFIPESGDKVSAIIGGLVQNGVSTKGIQLLGTALWDNPATLANPRLRGAWYASTPYEDSDAFNTRFQQSFNYKPEDIAGLGYDAVALAVQIAPGGFSDSDLRRSYGFRGVKGVYKFNGENINLRGYAIYEVGDGNARVIDTAPDHF